MKDVTELLNTDPTSNLTHELKEARNEKDVTVSIIREGDTKASKPHSTQTLEKSATGKPFMVPLEQKLGSLVKE